jgi:Leucine-rich repeat (LRR) protein
MAKGTLYPLFAAQDEPTVRPILDALKGKGFSVDPARKPKNGVVLFFLSANMREDMPEIDEFLRLDAQKSDVIPVNLDGSAPPELIENAIMARNTIFAERYTGEELVDRIARALKKPVAIASKLRKWIVAAAAVVLLAVIGIVLWRVLGSKEAEETVVETTPAPTPAPTAAPVIPGGIPPEDVGRIFELIFIGDQMHYSFGDEEWVAEQGWARIGAEHYATLGYDLDGAHWYSTEDGNEIKTAHWDDLSFLQYMTNLRLLTFVCVDGTLPDLSGLEQLDSVELFSCSAFGIEGLRGSGIMHFGYNGDPIDLSPLNDCPALSIVDLQLNLTDAADLSGFHPPALNDLTIRNIGQTFPRVDLSGLRQCTALNQLILDSVDIDNLQFIENCTELQSLYLHSLNLKRLDGVENLKELRYLELMNVSNLADISAIEGCTALETFSVWGYPQNVTVSDLSALGKLPHLGYVSNTGALNTDLNFLKEMPTKEDIIFIFEDSGVTDYSGFAAMKSYRWLCINMNGKDIAPAVRYLKDTPIKTLRLTSAANTDLSISSHVKQELILENCDIQDLATLSDSTNFELLTIEVCSSVQSLNGIEKNKAFGTLKKGTAKGSLYIDNCPHLIDFSALEGLYLSEFKLVDMNVLPDFSAFAAETYCLKGFPEMTDLSCFDGLDPSRSYSFDVSGLEGLRDISALSHLKGKKLIVRPELKEQAQELVASGNFETYEIMYPGSSWHADDSEFKLLSLDELYAQPKSVLARVRSFCLAGDHLFDESKYRIEEEGDALYLCRYDSDERIPIEPGTRLTDLSALKNLTGLKRLKLYAQPLHSLDGIQYLESLEELTVERCGSLGDVSPVFTLQGLIKLTLRNGGLSSLEGIQNLFYLEELTLDEPRINDLSPLPALPNLREVKISNRMRVAQNSLGGNYGFELIVE